MQHQSIEHAPLQLAPEAEKIAFGDAITFLRNTRTGALLKLTREESDIVREFDGTRTIADLLHQRIESGAAAPFQTVYELVTQLRNSGLLQTEPGTRVDVGHATQASATAIPQLAGIGARTLVSLDSLSFGGPLSRAVGRVLASRFFLCLVLVAAAANALVQTTTSGVNILQGFSVAASAPDALRYMSYLVSMASVWACFCLILTTKNLISACAVSAKGYPPSQARLAFSYGMVYLAVDLDAVVKAGPALVSRIYAVRIAWPFVVMFACAGAWQWVWQAPLLVLLGQTALLAGLLGLSPVLNSDAARALFLLSPIKSDMRSVGRFLSRRFLAEILSFKKATRAQNYYMLVSLLGLVWFYGLYQVLWDVLRPSLVFLLADLNTPILWGRLLVGFYMALLLAPPVLVLLSAIGVAITNVKAVTQPSLRRLGAVARQVASRRVAAQDTVLEFLENVPLFSTLSREALTELCSNLTMARFRSGSTIVAQGERGDCFYTIVTGKVRVIREDASGARHVVETLSTGDCFGEVSLVQDVPRTATVKSVEPTVVFRLGRREFNAFVAKSADGAERITEAIRLSHLVRGTPVFAYLAPRQVSALVRTLRPQRVGPGAALFSQGDAGDRFYIVCDGSVSIHREENGRTVLDRTLSKGDYFGEIALVKNMPRTASARSLSGATVVSLGKQEFFDVLGASLLTGIEVENVARARLAKLGAEAAVTCS